MEYFEKEVETEKLKLKNKFKSYVYNFLKNKDIGQKEGFYDYVNEYEDYNEKGAGYEIINSKLIIGEAISAYFDELFKADLLKTLDLTYDTLLIQKDYSERFNENKIEFKKKLDGEFFIDDLDAFLSDQKNKSLLLFAEYDELKKRFEAKFPIKPNKDQAGSSRGQKRKSYIYLNGKNVPDDFQSLKDNIDDDLKDGYGIKDHSPKKPDNKPENKHQNYSTRGNKVSISKKNTEVIGFIGEYYVHENLAKEYETVKWVSEYARKVGANDDGNDNEGYDLHYFDDKGEIHYVEVKASSGNDFLFHISSAEVRFGENHRKNHEIIFVSNALSRRSRELKNLGSIFDYDDDESFNNNNKFSVESDGFKIRFS